MFGRSGALAALALAATRGFALGPSGASKSAHEDVVILGGRGRGTRMLRAHFVDRSRYTGRALREIRSSTERQARECARRRRQAREHAVRLGTLSA